MALSRLFPNLPEQLEHFGLGPTCVPLPPLDCPACLTVGDPVGLPLCVSSSDTVVSTLKTHTPI